MKYTKVYLKKIFLIILTILIKSFKQKFFFTIEEKPEKLDKNINKIVSILFTLFKKYKYAKIKQLSKTLVINQFLIHNYPKDIIIYKSYTLIFYKLIP